MSDDTKVDAGTAIKGMLAAIQAHAFEARQALDLCGELAEQAEDLVADIQRGRPLTRRERILVSLASETRTQAYLADDTGIPYSALVAELTLMTADGLAEKVGKGAYRAVMA